MPALWDGVFISGLVLRLHSAMANITTGNTMQRKAVHRQGLGLIIIGVVNLRCSKAWPRGKDCSTLLTTSDTHQQMQGERGLDRVWRHFRCHEHPLPLPVH